MVSFADAEEKVSDFGTDGPAREFYESVCQWVQKAVPGKEGG